MIRYVVRHGWSGPYLLSSMERDCTTTLGMCHGLSVLMGQRFILISSENLPLCRAWLHLLHCLPIGVGELLSGAPKAVLALGWTRPAPSVSPHRETAPGPQCSGPTLHLLQFFHVSHVLEDQNWMQYSRCIALINVEWKEMITSFLNLPAMPLLIQPRM